MLEYIEEIFGVKARIETWDEEKRLPLFLRNKRQYYRLILGNYQCLLMKISIKEFRLAVFQKQIQQLNKYTNYQVVLWLDMVSSYQRKVLIQNKISFIVPGMQMYVPSWGISLREQFQTGIDKVEKMSAMAQYLLLYLIYRGVNISYTHVELAAKLNISAMNVSRAVQELQALELVTVHQQGRSKLVKAVSYGKDLYKLSKDYMRSPVQKTIYVERENAYMDFPVAGEEALSRRSMLNPPRHRICALDKKRLHIIPGNKIVDPNWTLENEYMEIELWKYNPELFAQAGAVDVISLSLSLESVEDERVEMQLEEMMEDYEW